MIFSIVPIAPETHATEETARTPASSDQTGVDNLGVLLWRWFHAYNLIPSRSSLYISLFLEILLVLCLFSILAFVCPWVCRWELEQKKKKEERKKKESDISLHAPVQTRAKREPVSQEVSEQRSSAGAAGGLCSAS